uniref:Uncharacterized protein n=1 Tax=Oryza sativa subsp. japonica TaxID=39947 RepID=Q69S82_ORYSJ|nr:hypothetical protein [Oryza sativa Japonica Group]
MGLKLGSSALLLYLALTEAWPCHRATGDPTDVLLVEQDRSSSPNFTIWRFLKTYFKFGSSRKLSPDLDPGLSTRCDGAEIKRLSANHVGAEVLTAVSFGVPASADMGNLSARCIGAEVGHSSASLIGAPPLRDGEEREGRAPPLLSREERGGRRSGLGPARPRGIRRDLSASPVGAKVAKVSADAVGADIYHVGRLAPPFGDSRQDLSADAVGAEFGVQIW